MTQLSAADAIAPAWKRMRELLFAQRSFRLFLKLAAVATLAELSNGFNLRLGNVNTGPWPHGSGDPGRAALSTALIVGVLVGALLLFAVMLVLFYCGSRMQLVMIDVVASKETTILPLWRKYGSSVWRWIGLKLLAVACFMLAMLLVALPFIVYFVIHFGTHGNKQTTGTFFAGAILAIVALVLLVLLLALVFAVVVCLLADFVPPSIAIENVSLGESVRRVRGLCRREPGAVALYLLLRFALALAMGIGSLLALGVAALIAGVPIGGIGALLYFGLRHGGAGAHGVLIAAAVIGAVLFLAWMFLAYVCVAGVTGTFFRAYALYFLGGRYPMLGELLERSTSAPPPLRATASWDPALYTPPSV